MKFSQIKYKRPNFEQLFYQMDSVIEEFKSANNAREQYEVYCKYETLLDRYGTNCALARIRSYMDIGDEFYRVENQQFIKNNPLLKKRSKTVNELMLNSPYKNELEKYVGKLTLINAAIAKTTFDDSVIEEQREESRLMQEYVRLMAELSVEQDGARIPLSMLSPQKESTDRKKRQAAYALEGECYNAIKDQLDEIFDRLVKNRTEQAKKLGFKSFVELGYARMCRNCYNSDDVKIFRQQVQSEVVPVVKRISAKRSERLGLQSLCFHDLLLSHKEGSPKPQVEPNRLIDIAKKMYSEMSPDTKGFIELMIDNELFDLYSRLGKSPGGFCSFIKDYNYPFIFANFNGTAYDVNVMTHEAGHAFARFMTNKEDGLYDNSTMDVAECCSMGMEFLTMPWHDLFFGDNTEKYHQKLLEDAIIFIPYACQVDEFQQYIYENPNLTPSERDRAWLEIEKLYRPDMDYADISFYSAGGGWQRQSHIYKTPFYYIDYALAQVTALCFYFMQRENPDEAFNKYMRFLANMERLTYTELLSEMDFVSPLEKGSLKQLINSLKGLI